VGDEGSSAAAGGLLAGNITGAGMTCRCQDFTELWDAEAKDYEASHLRPVETRANGWEAVFGCPESGMLWLEDWPERRSTVEAPVDCAGFRQGDGGD
jgi:hypothetical protein